MSYFGYAHEVFFLMVRLSRKTSAIIKKHELIFIQYLEKKVRTINISSMCQLEKFSEKYMRFYQLDIRLRNNKYTARVRKVLEKLISFENELPEIKQFRNNQKKLKSLKAKLEKERTGTRKMPKLKVKWKEEVRDLEKQLNAFQNSAKPSYYNPGMISIAVSNYKSILNLIHQNKPDLVKYPYDKKVEASGTQRYLPLMSNVSFTLGVNRGIATDNELTEQPEDSNNPSKTIFQKAKITINEVEHFDLFVPKVKRSAKVIYLDIRAKNRLMCFCDALSSSDKLFEATDILKLSLEMNCNPFTRNQFIKKAFFKSLNHIPAPNLKKICFLKIQSQFIFEFLSQCNSKGLRCLQSNYPELETISFNLNEVRPSSIEDLLKTSNELANIPDDTIRFEHKVILVNLTGSKSIFEITTNSSCSFETNCLMRVTKDNFLFGNVWSMTISKLTQCKSLSLQILRENYPNEYGYIASDKSPVKTKGNYAILPRSCIRNLIYVPKDSN
ncbi:unnamed protein product [Moneuplotes crassus]|uniref:Uncharacterized protein n=1 Tax=Euplotes crassus TaxID=5936 RepID=A0AAD2DAC5_EUPCR|nr:unnamed protein product [Moneuplotes crassus]